MHRHGTISGYGQTVHQLFQIRSVVLAMPLGQKQKSKRRVRQRVRLVPASVDPLTPGIGCSLGPGAGEPDANATCTVSALTTTEKYKVESEGGKDTDRLTLIPVP